MSKYKFSYEETGLFDDSVDKTVEVSVSGDGTWHDLFEEFRGFLNGCGYQVPCGSWVSEEDEEEDDEFGDAGLEEEEDEESEEDEEDEGEEYIWYGNDLYKKV